MKFTYSWFACLLYILIFGTGILCRKLEKRQTSNCSDDTFRCTNGFCIDSSLICDGNADCSDRSDETHNLCNKLFSTCPGLSFRCKYGACVAKDLKCDGKNDCVDGSDEDVVECRGGNNQSNTNNKNVNSQSACQSSDEFNCINGQCIDGTNICDGVKHCTDGSDETTTLCKNIPCPKYTFKCKYGACINKESKCNKVKNCIDGSDEENCFKTPITTLSTTSTPFPETTNKRPNTPSSNSVNNENKCVIPNSEGSIYLNKNTKQTVSPGSRVEQRQVIEEDCKKGYFKIDRYRHMTCSENGEWETYVNDTLCSKMCPPLVSNDLQFECNSDGVSVNCSTPMKNGTRAVPKCKPTHQLPNGIELTPTVLICLSDGKWDGQLFKCVPFCGKVYTINKVQTLIVNAENASYGTAPWNAGIYENKNMICGGTLISENIVVSAAHCFERNLVGTDKVITNNDIYKIGIGKYDRDIKKIDNKYTQIIDVSSVHVNQDYFGSVGHYLNDIAIIILETKATMSDVVMPACMDWNKRYTISDGENGKIVGWGKTEKMQPSPYLLEAKLPYINENVCRNMYKKKNNGFEIFVGADKFCAGSPTVSGQGVHEGDSGAGLTFAHNDLHYLTGIVSLHDPSKKNSIAVFTKVNYHTEWIRKILLSFTSV